MDIPEPVRPPAVPIEEQRKRFNQYLGSVLTGLQAVQAKEQGDRELAETWKTTNMPNRDNSGGVQVFKPNGNLTPECAELLSTYRDGKHLPLPLKTKIQQILDHQPANVDSWVKEDPAAALLPRQIRLDSREFNYAAIEAPTAAIQHAFARLNPDQRAFCLEHSPAAALQYQPHQLATEEFAALCEAHPEDVRRLVAAKPGGRLADRLHT